MKHFLKIAFVSLLLTPLAHAQLTLSGGSGGGGASCTFATPYIICGGVTADSNFTPVTLPNLLSTWTEIDDPADVTGNYTYADTTHSASGLPPWASPIGTTNGDVVITGGVAGASEAQLHFSKVFSPSIHTVQEEFSLSQAFWGNHSPNGGMVVFDCTQNFGVIYAVFGNMAGPIQIEIAFLQANFTPSGGSPYTCGTAQYNNGNFWSNFNAPPTGPYYGGGAGIYSVTQPNLHNVQLRVRTATFSGLGALVFDYKGDGDSVWSSPIIACNSTTSGCQIDFPPGVNMTQITNAGPYYYTGGSMAHTVAASIFDLKSWNAF